MTIAGLRKAEPTPEEIATPKRTRQGLLSSFGSRILGKNRTKNSSSKTSTPSREEEKTKEPFVVTKKATPNSLLCALGSLATQLEFTTGDPIKCNNCPAILSSLSILQDIGEAEYTWHCEFCGFENEHINLDEEELPSKERDVCEFLLEPPIAAGEENEPVLIFCIDISGSMCVTSEVPGLQAEWKRARNGNVSDVPVDYQYLPGERPGAQYIKRLDCIKTAVQTQLDRTLVEQPKRKVLLITFNNEIQVLRSNNETITIAGDQLDNIEELAGAVQNFNWDAIAPISQCHATLRKQIEELEETGATALGPALSVAVNLCKSFHRSEVILCTDGMPNVGVGALDSPYIDVARQFYVKLAAEAKKQSTMINVIAIEGCNCSLEDFKMCAEYTNGQLNTLHPLEVVRQIRKIAQNPVIAAEVELTVLLHPLLVFNGPHEYSGKHVAQFALGNATKASDLTFTFECARKSQKKYKSLTAFPFQYQISFKRQDGSRCMRVISQTRLPTTDREAAEKSMNVAIVSLATIQKLAAFAESKNDYEEARLQLHAARKMIERGASSKEQREEYSNFVPEAEILETELKKCYLLSQKSKIGDDSVKVFYQMKQAELVKFVCAEKQYSLLQQNKGNKKLNEQYYNYQFN